jgi:hypothetical protein
VPCVDKMGLFDRPESEFECRDDDAIALWPYPVPDIRVDGLAPRYHLGLYPVEGPHYRIPSWLSIHLCPADSTPEEMRIASFARQGIVKIHYYQRAIDPNHPVGKGYTVARGWKHPEHISGRALSKTVRVFHGPVVAPDGLTVGFSYEDNPRLRSRAEAFEIMNEALSALRPHGPLDVSTM